MLTKPFTVRLVSDPEQVGIVVSEHLIPVPNPENPQLINYKAQLGVLWESQRSPAISYWEPDQLEWMAVLDMTAMGDVYEDDEEEEEDEFEGEEETEVQEVEVTPQPQ